METNRNVYEINQAVSECVFDSSDVFNPNHSFLNCRSEAKKTKVKKKTNNPQFDEVFYFEVCASVECTLKPGIECPSQLPRVSQRIVQTCPAWRVGCAYFPRVVFLP